VAAHPDDEVLGCGGTIAKLRDSEGVHLFILGEGVTSRAASRERADDSALRSLREDAERCGQVLGAKSVSFGGLPDNRFDSIPLLEVVKRIETAVQRFEPDRILTHHPGDLNVDHGVTFRAVLTAVRPMAGSAVRELLCFEVPSSTEWAFQRVSPVFRPSVFVDVSATLETKIQAMQCYRSEIRPWPHPRSPEALRASAHRWGSVVGTDAAEAFEAVFSLRA
jgi:LmbE family N-acetylglucosaminyl deacetylase